MFQDNTDHLNLPNSQNEVYFFGENGKLAEDEKTACAMQLVTPQNESMYYVKYGSSQLYNPNKKYDVRYNKRIIWKLRSVSKKIFDLYILFLQNKHEVYLRSAEREI